MCLINYNKEKGKYKHLTYAERDMTSLDIKSGFTAFLLHLETKYSIIYTHQKKRR